MGREAWMPKEQDRSGAVRQPICVKTHLRANQSFKDRASHCGIKCFTV